MHENVYIQKGKGGKCSSWYTPYMMWEVLD